MKFLKSLIFLVLFSCVAHAQLKQHPMFLWYNRPAPQKDSIPYGKDYTISKWGTLNGWDYALPVGNGRIGAMMFGGVNHERIQLNEETLWGGYKRKGDNPLAGASLQEIQHLLFQGKSEEATKLAEQKFVGVPMNLESYQSLSDLFIDNLDRTEKFESYYRELNIDSAIAKVKYKANGKWFTREMFASHPNQVIAIKYHCNVPGGLSFQLSMLRERDAKTSSLPNNDSTLIQSGQIMAYDSVNHVNKGLKFQTQLRVSNNGGTIASKDGILTVKNANEVVIYIVAGTNYRNEDPAVICQQYLDKIKDISYAQLRDNHIKDYMPLFSRTKIKLGNGNANDLPTDERIKNAAKNIYDPYLSELAYNFGKYILISSSRKGDLASNLQGLWCQHNLAPWNSDYHANINLQMNYWGAEVSDLSECHLPLFDLIDSVSIPGKQTALDSYHANGWVLHHATDAYWRTSPIDGVVGIWPFGGAWLTRHMWEHYLYTGDKDFLKERAYPQMKGAAEFILDFLVKVPKGLPFEGKWITNPSHSPENAYEDENGVQSMFTYGATMDLELIHDLFTNCIQAIDVMNGAKGKRDFLFKSKLQSTLANLVPLQISKKTGKLQEWIKDYKEIELGHRHFSHLFALFPGSQITPVKTPALANAASLSIQARLHGNPNWEIDEANNKFLSYSSYLNGDGGGNWQRAWLTALWARLGKAEEAFDSHKRQFKDVIPPNLLGDGRVQVDGSMGLTGAVTEMLLQSHEGFIHILPALPKDWSSGFLQGIKARGGFKIDQEWQNNKLSKLKITSLNGNMCTLKLENTKVKNVYCHGKPLKFSVLKNGNVQFKTQKNVLYTISIK